MPAEAQRATDDLREKETWVRGSSHLQTTGGLVDRGWRAILGL